MKADPFLGLRLTPLDPATLAPDLDRAILVDGVISADPVPEGDEVIDLSTTREMSVEVELGPITAEGYRVLLGHPFARHAARGGDLVTVASLKARDTAERALAFARSIEGKPYRYDGGLGPCGEPGPDGVACDLQRNHDCQHAAYGREPDADGNVGLRRTWGRMTDVERALAEADPYRPWSMVDPFSGHSSLTILDPPRRTLLQRIRDWWFSA